uniref:Armadillo repeat containing 2 n=1 Tax=Malurus cyaneus samueli TaxID=2593467 RepID=A0A8C5T6J9_9PASS
MILLKAEPFYWLSVAKPKTSAEIVNEARDALRTVRTQRPFTPTDEQRKLFGSRSSQCPQSRPASVFSLHASSFDLAESRPLSGVRLSPLGHKPMLISSAKDEDSSVFLPKPPADAAEVRKVSNAQKSLFRATSPGNLFSSEVVPPDQSKNVLICIICWKNNHMMSFSIFNYMNYYIKGPACPFSVSFGNALDKVALIIIFYFSLPSYILQIEDNIENLCLACTKLYQALNEGNMLGKRFKRRNVLLKTLYKLVDIDSDPLCLKLAKIILAMKVDGRNLLSVCKLAFKICKDKKNDLIVQNDTFQNDALLDYLLEVLRNEDLQKNNEALVYCMGAIKFMSGNAVLLNEMVNRGAVEMLLQLMKQINNIKEHDTYFSNLGHLLVQLTATVRTLADFGPARCRLSCSGAVSELCVALEQRGGDKDVCTCIVRILSKLSSYNDFCAALADCSRCYILFLALLNKHQKQQDIVIRIIFILGNLTAKNNKAREQFFKEKESVNTLTSLFQTYYELDLSTQRWYHDRKGKEKNHLKHPSEAEDVLIKLIRVLANLSIHPTIGAALAAAHPVVGLLVTVLEYKSVDDCEELVINAATTINNLSYYQVKDSAVQDKKLHIAEKLLKLLMSDNMDAVVEAVRVFGNLSQHHEIRDFIMQKNIYKFMITLLDSKKRDVCFFACGVLLNLTVDKNKRAFLMEEGGIGKLVDCLQDFGPADWQLSCLICKTLWNYSENITSTASCFGGDTDTLLALLTSLLDEEVELDCSLDRDIMDCQRVYWEREFKPVAEKLLDRIQSHHSFLPAEPITSF